MRWILSATQIAIAEVPKPGPWRRNADRRILEEDLFSDERTQGTVEKGGCATGWRRSTDRQAKQQGRQDPNDDSRPVTV